MRGLKVHPPEGPLTGEDVQKALFGLLVTLMSIVAASVADHMDGSPPVLVEGSPTQEFYPAGKTVNLRCKGAPSKTPSSVEWYHKGHLLKPNENAQFSISASDSSTLVIRTKFGESEGKYRCVLRNAFGSVMSQETQLTVTEFRTKGDRWRVSNVSVVEGGPASLPCNHVYSVPNASFSWFTVGCPKGCHDDKLVILDDRITVDHRGTLVFTHATSEDNERLYKCIAYNPVLRTRMGGSYARLFVLPNPFPPNRVPSLLLSSQTPPEAVLGGDVIMRCIFAGVPTALVTWKLPNPDRKRHVAKDFGRELHLSGLQLEDAGDYSCVGHNALGEGAPVTIRLNITAAPRTNENLVQHRNVTIGEEVEVSCEAEGTPPFHREWFKDGRPWNHTDENDELTLHNITQTTSLTCIISNKYGSIMKVTHISLIPDQPEPTTPPPHQTSSQISQTTEAPSETSFDDSSTATSAFRTTEGQDPPLIPGDPDGLYSERSIYHEALTLTAQVMAPLVFLMALASALLCVCVRARRKKASYRVDYRERHFGLHQECESDDSGYDEKEEKSVQRRLKRERSKIVDAECHL